MNVRWVIVLHYRTDPKEVVNYQKFDNEFDAEMSMRKLVNDIETTDRNFLYATVERRVYADFID